MTVERTAETDEFLSDCRAYVHQLAGRMFGHNDADDITQEVMVRLLRNLRTLDLDRPIRPWLATVTRNVGISALRARRDVTMEGDELADHLEHLPDEPQRHAERVEAAKFLGAALHRLSAQDAELLILHEFEDVSLHQIAQLQGVEQNAIRQRLFRARRRLGAHYLDLGGPRSVLWPAPFHRIARWMAARRRSLRRSGAVAGSAALAVLAASLVGDGEQRLRPVPIPPPPAVPAIAADTGRPRSAPVAVSPSVAPSRSRERPSEPRPEVYWRLVDSADQPPPRREAAFAYDEAHDEYVLFGGLGADDQPLGDTWTSPDARVWTRRVSTLSPSPRRGAAMVYDAAHHELVLFGGEEVPLGWELPAGFRADVTRPPSTETWTWDGDSWSRHDDLLVHPPGAAGAAFAYDAARRVALLFGGARPGIDPAERTLYDTTFAWDGRAWHELDPLVRPSPREGAAASYDAGRRRIVLFGGHAGGDPLADVVDVGWHDMAAGVAGSQPPGSDACDHGRHLAWPGSARWTSRQRDERIRHLGVERDGLDPAYRSRIPRRDVRGGDGLPRPVAGSGAPGR